MSNNNSTIAIFLCYAKEDYDLVNKYYAALKDRGFSPWIDENDLLPGQNWRIEIPKKIKESDFVIVFLSSESVLKRGYVQKEYKLALSVLDEMPEESIYIIPARLDECNIPNQFESLQWTDLFKKDGFDKLIKVIDIYKGQRIIDKKDKRLKCEEPRKEENQTVTEHISKRNLLNLKLIGALFVFFILLFVIFYWSNLFNFFEKSSASDLAEKHEPKFTNTHSISTNGNKSSKPKMERTTKNNIQKISKKKEKEPKKIEGKVLDNVVPFNKEIVIRENIRNALKKIDAKRHGSMGSFYILDKNSRRVYAKLRQKLKDYSIEELTNGLLFFLDDKDSLTRWKAMRLLIYLKYSDSKRVRKYWNDESEWIERKIILEAVKNLPNKDAFDLLLYIAKFDDSDRIRSSALNKLESFSNERDRQRVIDVYLESLSDNGRSVRHIAIKGLRKMRISEAVEEAQRLILKDESNFVRVEASKLLAEQGTIESLKNVILAFSRNLINDYVFNRCIHTYRSRFGKDALLAEVARMENLKDRDRVEAIILKSE